VLPFAIATNKNKHTCPALFIAKTCVDATCGFNAAARQCQVGGSWKWGMGVWLLSSQRQSAATIIVEKQLQKQQFAQRWPHKYFKHVYPATFCGIYWLSHLSVGSQLLHMSDHVRYQCPILGSSLPQLSPSLCLTVPHRRKMNLFASFFLLSSLFCIFCFS